MSTSETAILFDVDGTLVDSTYHHALCWQRAFQRSDLSVPVWRLHRAIGMGGDRLVAAVTDEDVEQRHGDAVRSAWREEYATVRHQVLPLPGAAPLVSQLATSRYRVALASSGDPEFTRDAVDLLGIADQVEVVTTADDAEESKPEAELVATTLARMPGIKRAVLVGDTPYDVQAASRAGLGCIALRSGGYADSELRAAGAVVVRDDPEELKDLDWVTYLAGPTTKETR